MRMRLCFGLSTHTHHTYTDILTDRSIGVHGRGQNTIDTYTVHTYTCSTRCRNKLIKSNQIQSHALNHQI